VAQDSQPTWQELLDLVAQLSEGDFESVAVSYGTISVRLSRTGVLPGGGVATALAGETAPVVAPSVAPSPASGASPAAVSGAAITAPMLGVFYRRPAPGAEPFVTPGQAVEPDTTIGIIEIMKLMNPVSAGVSGVIAAFEVEDGTSVEFGQTLARLEPSAP
jgi:acetyl-CoA carboxylase biotin carboxyl carrier protein